MVKRLTDDLKGWATGWDDDEGPWMPGPIFNFLFMPIACVGLFIGNKVSGFRGMIADDAEPVAFADIDWSELPMFVLGTMALYFFLSIPYFWIRRKLWEKNHQ